MAGHAPGSSVRSNTVCADRQEANARLTSKRIPESDSEIREALWARVIFHDGVRALERIRREEHGFRRAGHAEANSRTLLGRVGPRQAAYVRRQIPIPEELRLQGRHRPTDLVLKV